MLVMITRQQAINLFGSAVAVAEALGYTSRHAIYMWPKTGRIPEGAYLKIRYELKPDAFDAAGNLIAARRPRKNVAADSSVHGETASSKRRALKTPRVAGSEASRG